MPKPNFAEASEALAADVLADRQAGISSDATILAWRIHLGETSELLVDERRLDEIAREIDQVLARIRNRYPETTGVAARPRYSPATLLLTVDGDLLDAIAQRWDGASEFRLTGVADFDELNAKLGLHSLQSMPLIASAIMHFSERANMHAARQAYLAVEGVVGAELDAHSGDGPDIAAAKVSGRWFVMMRDAWGDCTSGCLHSKTSFFVVSHKHVEIVDRERAEGMVEFRRAVPPGDWPKWIE
ncbi:MAG: hypothetical protein F4Y60_11925 [Boseongicola sp. SB0664_bin_43]|uniref:Uncharacterized protein n=1 Tax=Boseongicola sp. SB0664_bin_43 TaxID=2604844 RepID=A0A6B0Y4Y3_9RHOB|nr:hypothetical protein [Boseongicola sp. SB0664_bin_43]MYK30693.1 hypothetical protein [Boseongicola sp. SB0670_bin_30]